MHVSLNKSSGQTSLGSEDLLSAWDWGGGMDGLGSGPWRLTGWIHSRSMWTFIFVSAGSSLLHGLFSSCGELGLLFIAVGELLIAVISLVVELRLQGIPAQ